jgi:hypothetical protein
LFSKNVPRHEKQLSKEEIIVLKSCQNWILFKQYYAPPLTNIFPKFDYYETRRNWLALSKVFNSALDDGNALI